MKLIREHINEKFQEDSDPVEDLGIGMRNFLEKEYEIEGRTTSEEGSIKFFGSKRYPEEAFCIYLFLGYLLEKENLNQDSINKAYSEMLNRRQSGKIMKNIINQEKVKEAIKKHYGINIDSDE
jgi:hypothetical protein